MRSNSQVTQEPTALKCRVMKGVKTMRTPKTLLCAVMLSVMPVASLVRPIATAGQTDLYGGIGRGSLLNPGALITVDQHTGVGTLVGHPDSVPGLTGLVFDISGTLYGTTISGMLGTGRFSTLVRIDPSTGGADWPGCDHHGWGSSHIHHRPGASTRHQHALRHKPQ